MMKTRTLLLTLLLTVGYISMQAQSCAEKHAAMKSCHGTAIAAATLAAQDDNIEKRVCPATGAVSYVEKQTCTHSGKVTYADVQYDAQQGKFVRLASLQEAKTHESESARSGAAGSCGSKKSACCSDKKSCCGNKSASANTTSEKATVKLVKSQKGT